MKQFFAVFKFEISKYMKNKVFVILTVVIFLGIGITFSFPRLAELIDTDEPSLDEDNATSIAIINNSEYDDDILIQAFKNTFANETISLLEKLESSAKDMVLSEDYDYVVSINTVDDYTIVASSIGIYQNITNTVDFIINGFHKQYLLQREGLSADNAKDILNSKVNSTIIETGKNQKESYFYTYLLVFLLYLFIMLYGQLVAVGVASEKSSRAMEVLITTVHPVKMMFGKVIGSGIAALSQMVIILGSGIMFYSLNQTYWSNNDIIGNLFKIPTDVIVISTVLFILGFFLYAFLYAAIGSLVSSVEDTNTAVLPLTFCMMAAFMIVIFSMTSGNLDSPLVIICSYFPLTSPVALLVRFSMSDMSTFEIVTSTLILFITTVGAGVISAIIYRIGVLLYGNKPSIKEVIKLVRIALKN